MIRGGTGENARLREQRKAEQRANDLESLDRVNELLRREAQRFQADLQELASSAYRPDETDDQWATDWQNDFDRSAAEYDSMEKGSPQRSRRSEGGRRDQRPDSRTD
jgi:hypothetical protein